MKMKDIHLKVLEMMERVRSKVEFWYGTRTREAPKSKILRLKEGYIFLGGEDYVWVPICPVSVPANKTKAVGIVFKVDGGEVVESWVELVIPKAGVKTNISVVTQLRKLLPMYEFKNVVSNQHYDRYNLMLYNNGKTTEVINQTEVLLERIVRGIVNLFNGCSIPVRPYSSVYTQKMMSHCITRFLSVRHGIEDETNQKMRELLNAI